MSENEFFSGSPKTMFFSGFVAGVALIAVITSLYLANMSFNNGTLIQNGENKVVQEEDDGDTVEVTAANVPEVTEDDNYIGNLDAKIVLIEYSDIECPFCFRHRPTIETVVEELGDDVVWVFRHFPLSFHPQAVPAAKATECAGEQDKFFEYLDIMFENQSNLGDEFFLQTATDLGLDTAAWQTCLESEEVTAKIAQQMSDGAAAGVKGTPATFINGQMVSGAVPLETFRSLVEAELE